MKVHIEFDPASETDLSAARSFLAVALGVTGATAAAPATAAKPKGDDEKAKKEAAAAEAKAAKAKRDAEEAEEAEAAAAKKAEEDAGPKLTLEEVRAKLKEYAAIEGKDAAIKILKDHGAASISELDEAKYADVVAACGD